MGSRPPVNIRRNVESRDDSYSLEETSVCRECGSVYFSGRWYLPEQVADKSILKAGVIETLCPACQKMRDHVPHGVLRITGHFVRDHNYEIMNLIRNQTRKGSSINPLERIMTMETIQDGIEITTTNEKLAQRIGKALHRAYSGDVAYKWSDPKIARVNWHREV